MKTIIALTAGAALLAAASTAPAQAVGQSRSYTGDIAAFRGNDTTLIKAIQAVHSVNGARVVDIRYGRQDSIPGYRIVLQQNGRYTFMRIDERNGQVVAIDATNAPDWTLNWEKRTRLRMDRKAMVPLAQAIRTAEKANGDAPAVAAGIAKSASNSESDVYAYNVILDMNGQAKRVAVDARTGEIISDPGALTMVG
jgi:uncharacterized membrane protein YkoI